MYKIDQKKQKTPYSSANCIPLKSVTFISTKVVTNTENKHCADLQERMGQGIKRAFSVLCMNAICCQNHVLHVLDKC